MANLKEHGILFSSPMVRAILAGTKTQTRRLLKTQPPSVEDVRLRSGSDFSLFTDHHAPDVFRVVGPVSVVRDLCGQAEWKPPHGPVGRRLYVKETWATSIGCDKRKAKDMKNEGWPIWYRADDKVRFLGADVGGPAFMTSGKTRPSIHMPRWASRITLEVTRVRVERVGDIGEEDAKAEGVTVLPLQDAADPSAWWSADPANPATHGRTPVAAYRKLWDEINGAGSFASNPWVWVYDFRRVG